MSGYEYPEDEFDGADDDGRVPVGVHRAPAPRWRSWLPLLIVIVVVPVLAWGAVTLMGRAVDSGGPDATAAPSAPAQEAGQQGGPPGEQASSAPPAAEEATPTPTPSASADLTTGVTIHNGTTVNGLAARTGAKLNNAGFTAVTVSPSIYPNSEPPATTVYYASPDHEATAQAIAQALGVTNIVESAQQAQSNPIVIILRTDYQE